MNVHASQASRLDARTEYAFCGGCVPIGRFAPSSRSRLGVFSSDSVKGQPYYGPTLPHDGRDQFLWALAHGSGRASATASRAPLVHPAPVAPSCFMLHELTKQPLQVVASAAGCQDGDTQAPLRGSRVSLDALASRTRPLAESADCKSEKQRGSKAPLTVSRAAAPAIFEAKCD